MPIQSFSIENLQKIFDYENRKGNNLEKRFPSSFSASLKLLPDLQDVAVKIKETKDTDERLRLYAKRDELREKRVKLIEQTLSNIVETITFKNDRLEIEEGDVYGKQSYHFQDTLLNLFISKKVQGNIKHLYSVKPSHRNTIIQEILNLLEDKTPKYIIRTDIKSFYESIPQNKLITKLNEDYLLSVLTKRFINETIEGYNLLTKQADPNRAKGIPRGIGFSAYIAELYMREIDRSMSKLDDVIYYARYVDDIIIMFTPPTCNVKNEYINSYIKQVERIITKSGLRLNRLKTKEYNLLNNIRSITMETNYTDKSPKQLDTQNAIQYLGYAIGSRLTYETSAKLKLKEERIIADMTISKRERYENKISEAFLAYEQKRKHNNTKAFKLLETRIQYLTSNTRLKNNKESVFIGIFYSNRYIKTMSSIQILQSQLRTAMNSASLTSKQKSRLMRYTFQGGFVSKSFHNYPIKNKVCKGDSGGVEVFGLTEINSIW